MPDDFYDQLDEQVSSTERLPNGNAAIRVGDDVIDPAFCSVSALSRLPADHYAAVIAWITAERKRRSVTAGAHEAEVKAFAESQTGRIRFQHEKAIAWARKNL